MKEWRANYEGYGQGHYFQDFGALLDFVMDGVKEGKAVEVRRWKGFPGIDLKTLRSSFYRFSDEGMEEIPEPETDSKIRNELIHLEKTLNLLILETSKEAWSVLVELGEKDASTRLYNISITIHDARKNGLI